LRDRFIRLLGSEDLERTTMGRLDDCAALIVADALKREGYSARVSGADAEIESGKAETVCICFVERVSQARVAFTLRKLSRKTAATSVIVCRFGNIQDDQQEEKIEDTAPRTLAKVIAAVSNRVRQTSSAIIG
jgi:hypothetical protein